MYSVSGPNLSYTQQPPQTSNLYLAATYKTPSPVDDPQSVALFGSDENALGNHGAYLRSTLENIEREANDEDVAMADGWATQTIVLVLDTNILLGHLNAIKGFTADVERLGHHIVVIIPGIVLAELDGQKTHAKLSWFARTASTWIEDNFKRRKGVHVQSQAETCMASGNWKVRDKASYIDSDGANDELILDCCLYHHRRGVPTILVTADRNMRLKAQSEVIPTIGAEHLQCSRDLATELFTYFNYNIDLDTFSDHRVSYNPGTVVKGPAPKHKKTRSGGKKSPTTPTTPTTDWDEEDAMDIDSEDRGPTPYDLEPSHAWDQLHRQVIENFTMVLRTLVARVDETEETPPPLQSNASGLAASRYAPLRRHETKKQRKAISEWNARGCLDYLESKKSQPRSNLRQFLSVPYIGKGTGARPGHQWSKQDWFNALMALKAVGETWEGPDGSIMEWLRALQPHFNILIQLRTRPMGS